MALIAGTALPGAAAVTAQKVLTADQIASRANADMKKAKTYRVWGPVKDCSSGKTIARAVDDTSGLAKGPVRVVSHQRVYPPWTSG